MMHIAMWHHNLGILAAVVWYMVGEARGKFYLV